MLYIVNASSLVRARVHNLCSATPWCTRRQRLSCTLRGKDTYIQKKRVGGVSKQVDKLTG